MGIPVFFASHIPGRPRAGKKAPGLAWPDGGARACREQGANRAVRGPGKRRRGWRGPTKNQELAGRATPTGPTTRRFSRHIVGVARRRIKGLPGGRRQQGRPPDAFQGALLAWPDGGSRACKGQGANRAGRGPGKRRRGWRGPTVEQELAGRATPTGPTARRVNGAEVGVARRWIKGLQEARRQQCRPPGAFQGASKAGRAPGIEKELPPQLFSSR